MGYITFKQLNCRNCHKCIRYCPVKSIRFSAHQANVLSDDCILCGECYVVCPQNAKQIVDETALVNMLLASGEPVYASVAPSFTAYFDGVGIESMRAALKQLGFVDAEETAIGATLVKREYERISREATQNIVITSCCPTVNTLIEKYYPEITSCLAPVMTPMQAHCADIRRRHDNAKVVFMGPCLSKIDEAARVGVDAALTFDKVAAMFKKSGIELEKKREYNENSRTRTFPTTGGVLKSMTYKNPVYDYFTIDGLDSIIPALDDIRRGGVHRCFIEMSACAGSCVRGPIMRKKHPSTVRDYQAVTSYAGREDFEVPQPDPALLKNIYRPAPLQKLKPSQKELEEILRKMGKTSRADELNCGTCGYNTCREKAEAVYQGKAEVTMCLPYLMERSERFAGNILDNTPNGIIVVSDTYELLQINGAAMRMLHVSSDTDVIGRPLSELIDPSDFIDAAQNETHVVNKRIYYAEYNIYIELTIVNDKKSDNMIGIFRDVTDEESERKSRQELSRQTIETTDKVVDKQMRIVQEIASLLGETAAETKIALTKLKESISNEDR
jgi:iron only hydrogenase large subunit-like protein/PAS domain-containing protein